jgi:uncharacterized membrane protein YjjB (DUF3815 family)
MYIYDRGDVVSAIGATVVGILGSMYGHFSKGDALPSMMPGILVLLPVSGVCHIGAARMFSPFFCRRACL